MALETMGLIAWVEEKRRTAVETGASSIPTPKYRCELCRDTGQIVSRIPNDPLGIRVKECSCAIERRNRARIERSGLADVVNRYTFESYQVLDSQHKAIKDAAMRYAKQAQNEWFVIIGRPGSGKTHICTAIVSRLMERGLNCKYMLWRDEVRELKSLVNDDAAYKQKMDELKNVAVLYIDDFFKGNVTEGDKNVAFELLNSRYNQRLRTIISGERSIEQLMEVDEAVGSRIYERSKSGYCLASPGNNWRLS